MTKQDLQKELKEKLKAGVKPSHLKKSKSTGDLPQAQTPSPQPKRKSLEISPSSPSLKALVLRCPKKTNAKNTVLIARINNA